MATSAKSVVRTDAAPAPFQGAPYSQAIRSGDFVFVSGQLGLQPNHGEITGGIAEQTEQVFANLGAILEAAGSALDRLVKTTVLSMPTPFASGAASPGRARHRAP